MVCIVINNQVGFIMLCIDDMCLMQYCIDIVKMVQVLIFYVNLDDLEVVMFVIKLVLDFCNKFKCDVVIDLVCYCCYGYNELDELNVIQLLMYQKIKKYFVLCQFYVDQLIVEGVIGEVEVEKFIDDYCVVLDYGVCVVEEWCLMMEYFVDWCLFFGYDWDILYDGLISVEYLKVLGEKVISYLEMYKLYFCVNKVYQDCKVMVVGECMFDWGMVEILVYVLIVEVGISICMIGQDFGCGMFFYRYVVLYN